jgi:DNA-binding LytR/AlgR family response regulator
VIAEDEELLRQSLVDLLREVWPELDIVAECEDGGSALEAIDQHQPDVALLDIRMPGLTGLEVAQACGEASPATQIVFVTAFDQYAIDAFDKGAVDYLLKPISRERLEATVQRLQTRARGAAPDASAMAALLSQLRAAMPAAVGANAAPPWPGSPPARAGRHASSWWTTSPTSSPTTSTPW